MFKPLYKLYGFRTPTWRESLLFSTSKIGYWEFLTHALFVKSFWISNIIDRLSVLKNVLLHQHMVWKQRIWIDIWCFLLFAVPAYRTVRGKCVTKCFFSHKTENKCVLNVNAFAVSSDLNEFIVFFCNGSTWINRHTQVYKLYSANAPTHIQKGT